MAEEPSEETLPEREEPADGEKPGGGFQDLEAIQLEVEKRIRDNQRFLERFMEDDFEEGDEPEEEEGEDFEEL